MSPRTAKYVEAMIREGDSFDYSKWLKKVRQEEAQANQDQTASTSSAAQAHAISAPHFRNRRSFKGLMSKLALGPGARRSYQKIRSKTPKARLRQWLNKIHRAWDEFQASRARDAVYDYLTAVFTIVMHYRVRRKTNRLLRHALKFANLPFDKNADPFIAVIRCTCGNTVDAKTISKYARALRYASRRKEPNTRLKRFMKKMGGVNACADLYAKHFGRSNRVAPI